MNADLVAIGEMLVTVAGSVPGPLSVGAPLRLSVAGAEGNALITASRLGVRTAWMGRIAGDDAGRLVMRTLRGEGVSVDRAVLDPAAQTALLLRHPRTADVIDVAYYRRDCAGTRLSPADIDAHTVQRARMLHITGITPALGEGPARAITHAVDLAREAGVRVSLDVNFRAKLWEAASARRTLGGLARSASIVFANPLELALLGSADELLGAGVDEVVVKDGSRGASTVTAVATFAHPGRPARVVDPVGAGDAFVGAYLAAVLRDASIEQRLASANQAGSVAVATVGDWEGAAHRDEVAGLDDITDDVRR